MDEKEIKIKVSDGYIYFRAIIEILGKPKEHVVKTMDGYMKKIGETEVLEIVKQKTEEPVEQESMWSTFSEVEILAKTVKDVVDFAFDFMPSSIEIMDPDQFMYNSSDFTNFLNDIQGRLHAVNMGLQDYRQKNANLLKNSSILLRNFILVMLKQFDTKNELSKITGIKEDQLQQVLDRLIEEKKVEKKGGKFLLK